MDLREYDHITRQPDTYPKSTLRHMRRILESIDSAVIVLIDKILRDGYLEPPPGYKYHGCYRIALSAEEKEAVLVELTRARDELAEKTTTHSAKELQDELYYRGQFVDYWRRMMTDLPVPWGVARQQQTYIDVRQADLTQFERFIFEHDVADGADEDPWYFNNDLWIDFDEQRNAKLFIELFNSQDLIKRYSREQLEQGCWAMMGAGLDGSAHALIWDSALNIETKERLIEAMFDVYANLFSVDPLDTCAHMWWDSLAYDFNPMHEADPKANDEHRRIRDAMFRTLIRILNLDSHECQLSALHGLNHVQHPDTSSVISEYLARHPDLSDEDRDYALACARGEEM